MTNFFSSSKLLRINNEDGDILRVLRKTEESFTEFGEAYFSIVHMNSIKAWKKHNAMTMNLIVPTGCVGFVFTDGKDFKSCWFGRAKMDSCMRRIPALSLYIKFAW